LAGSPDAKYPHLVLDDQEKNPIDSALCATNAPAECTVSDKRFKNLTKRQRRFVDRCLHKTVHTKETMLLPPNKLIDKLFEMIASYGWTLYVLVSERCKMPDETPFFGDPKSAKKAVKKK